MIETTCWGGSNLWFFLFAKKKCLKQHRWMDPIYVFFCLLVLWLKQHVGADIQFMFFFLFACFMIEAICCGGSKVSFFLNLLVLWLKQHVGVDQIFVFFCFCLFDDWNNMLGWMIQLLGRIQWWGGSNFRSTWWGGSKLRSAWWGGTKFRSTLEDLGWIQIKIPFFCRPSIFYSLTSRAEVSQICRLHSTI